jgi:tetratricopeptide (TPR) repeat protein
MRIFSALLALGLTCGAFSALSKLDRSQRPDILAFDAPNESQPEMEKSVQLFTEALRREPSNPYRWSELGQAFLIAGDLEKARACYRRALELSRQVPQVWLRDANFHFQLDEPQDALRSAARVLETVPDYDDCHRQY